MKWWIAARLSFDFISASCNVLLHFLLLNVTFFQYPCIKTCFLNTPSFAVSHDINHLLCGIWLRSPDHFCLCFLGILNMDVTSKVWTWLKLLKMKPDISTLVLLALDRFPEVLSFGQIQLCRSAMFFFSWWEDTFYWQPFQWSHIWPVFFLIMLLWTLTFKVLTDACFCIFGLLTNK